MIACPVGDGSQPDYEIQGLSHDAPENGFRPSADVLFKSVASVYGSSALGIIMTGMGNDGTEGLKVLKGKGAFVLAQDERSSVVWGMPGAVAEAGLCSKILGLRELADEIKSTLR